MPDYDYDEYTRRHEEYEARRAAGEFDTPREVENATSPETPTTETEATETTEAPAAEIEIPAEEAPKVESEDDMSW